MSSGLPHCKFTWCIYSQGQSCVESSAYDNSPEVDIGPIGHIVLCKNPTLVLTLLLGQAHSCDELVSSVVLPDVVETPSEQKEEFDGVHSCTNGESSVIKGCVGSLENLGSNRVTTTIRRKEDTENSSQSI